MAEARQKPPGGRVTEVIAATSLHQKLFKIAYIPQYCDIRQTPYELPIVISGTKCIAVFIITDAKNHLATSESVEQ